MNCRCTTAIGVLCCFLAACNTPADGAATKGNLVFLTRGDCVNTPIMRANLDAALTVLDQSVAYQVV